MTISGYGGDNPAQFLPVLIVALASAGLNTCDEGFLPVFFASKKFLLIQKE